MSELVPSLQAGQVQRGIRDYLRTTYALADEGVQEALDAFLSDREQGIFLGPYVRTRMPFAKAEPGWERHLEWSGGFAPYGHQAAAFARLGTASLDAQRPEPLPTLVTTGTGSGKTESFLFPILDHVQRERRRGKAQGVKALILYPMNALANDQAGRISRLIADHDALQGVRAALYTGDIGPQRSTMSPDGLITNRATIKADPPDILLTNYKMLDQLLLREGDQQLWSLSTQTLRYVVLDEFHTYDGAQGTDVAMLLRRLQASLDRHAAALGDSAAMRPTPVATSATLGTDGDPTAMVRFAETVFGVPFDAASVVGETRLSVHDWAVDTAAVDARLEPAAIVPVLEAPHGTRADALVAALGLEGDAAQVLRGVPVVQHLLRACASPRDLDDLSIELFGDRASVSVTDTQLAAVRRRATEALLAVLSELRAADTTHSMPSIDLHLWVRSVTRLDRIAGPTPSFRWFDDGSAAPIDDDGDAFSDDGRPRFPAIYCRHCGRSGWMVHLDPSGDGLDSDDSGIRRKVLSGSGRQRALLFAPAEADAAHRGSEVPGLQWFDVRNRKVIGDAPVDEDEITWTLPVLALSGTDANDRSRKEECPACERTDAIRFLGSAVATLLSVAVTGIFGDHDLDASEKKALVFTNSVQDAAHRAGFVQSRAHVFGFRNAVRRALDAGPATLVELADRMIDAATDADARYRLLPPDIVERQEFAPYWRNDKPSIRVVDRVRRRLAFDLSLEFGLQSTIGRTLELTATAVAGLDVDDAMLLEAARATTFGVARARALDDEVDDVTLDVDSLRWVHGVLLRMRRRGAVEHPWLSKYLAEDGNRWRVWGGRPRHEGMPAFPPGRDVPSHPRVGKSIERKQPSELDAATSPKGWYARWAKKSLGVTASDGAALTRLLLQQLEADGVIVSTSVGGDARAYAIAPDRITVTTVDVGTSTLVCSVCRAPEPVDEAALAVLAGGPCLSARCPGRLETTAAEDNFYRRLYASGDMRRVVAREHTGLLDGKTRIAYEDGFKQSAERPEAPNVLVATPTLEMGIDIGDLSTVMLAGLPRTVASYVQRVGRAGRLTGNALLLAFVDGRGNQLARLAEPLATIDGAVRPPATYLDAEEILQRQYIAWLLDAQAASCAALGGKARDVLSSTDEGSLLGDLIATAEAQASTAVPDFLGRFADEHLGSDARDRLVEWATPGAVPRSSGLARTVTAVVQRWLAEESRLRFRRDAYQDAAADLADKASHPAATDEDKDAARTNAAALKHTIRALTALRADHWIAALERHGLLPNYALLDEAVRLGVLVTWIDPDAGKDDADRYKSETYELDRGASNAIRELVPGATFYSHGLEIEVDAIDLGPDGQDVIEWAMCPACGFAARLDLAPVPSSCPRCGSAAIADMGQRLHAVELQQVSAEVRRDEATISDRSDDRTSVQFQLRVAADIDPAQLTRSWFADGIGFGVRYFRQMEIRWLNLGRGETGTPLMIAGEEGNAPLFRVCESCGKRDSHGDANSAREHRPWCPHRTSKDEHAREIAIMRTLSTQACVLRIPPALTYSRIAMPSLIAAIRLGLREDIGGEPDHLAIERIVEPVTGTDVPVPALLLHDTVPGGTGYLADLARHERMRVILQAAVAFLEACPCQDEGKEACHRCLVPLARSSAEIPSLSRASALHSLNELLGDEDWEILLEDPGVASPETMLEQRFRADLVRRLQDELGATVTETMADKGIRLDITVAGSHWTLRPQVPMHGTVPDFLLQRHGDSASDVAIYCDGFAYHATQAVNRIADDAEKRMALRAQGLRVLAVTHRDLQDPRWFADLPWIDQQRLLGIAQQKQIATSALDASVVDPLSQIIEWVRDRAGAAQRWGLAAGSVPLALAGARPVGPEHVDPVGLARAVAAGAVPTADGFHGALLRDDGPLTVAVLVNDLTVSGLALALDDEASALAADGFRERWQIWLRLWNVLQHGGAGLELTSRSLLERGAHGGHAAAPADVALAPTVSVEWQEAFDDAEPEELEALRALEAGGAPVPLLGAEIAGLPIAISWEQLQLALLLESDEPLRDALERAGWRVVDTVAGAMDALAEE